MVDEEDSTVVHTSLREMEEELGIVRDVMEVLLIPCIVSDCGDLSLFVIAWPDSKRVCCTYHRLT
jgi:hypothetical protein